MPLRDGLPCAEAPGWRLQAKFDSAGRVGALGFAPTWDGAPWLAAALPNGSVRYTTPACSPTLLVASPPPHVCAIVCNRIPAPFSSSGIVCGVELSVEKHFNRFLKTPHVRYHVSFTLSMLVQPVLNFSPAAELMHMGSRADAAGCTARVCRCQRAGGACNQRFAMTLAAAATMLTAAGKSVRGWRGAPPPMLTFSAASRPCCWSATHEVAPHSTVC